MASATFRPVHDSVVFKLHKEKVSAGGLHLPDQDSKAKGMVTGIVVAVGPGRLNPFSGQRSEMPVKEGDRFILATTERCSEFSIAKGEKIFIVPADDIAAVVENYEEPQIIVTSTAILA
jgi:co-chaperonin GroES (HSP10)